MKKLVSIALILGVSAAMPAMAKDKDHRGSKDRHFEELDKNSDGVVNWSEQKAFSYKMFKDADKNGDKLLSSEELANFHYDRKKEHAGWRDRSRYDDMSPSAGQRSRSNFGSRKDQAYDSYKDTVSYEGVPEAEYQRNYDKNY